MQLAPGHIRAESEEVTKEKTCKRTSCQSYKEESNPLTSTSRSKTLSVLNQAAAVAFSFFIRALKTLTCVKLKEVRKDLCLPGYTGLKWLPMLQLAKQQNDFSADFKF